MGIYSKAFIAFATFIWLGFVFHSSGADSDVIGRYTLSYATFLVVLTSICAWAIWMVWKYSSRFNSILKKSLVVIAITTLLMFLVLPCAYIYVHHRSLSKHVFNPIDQEAHSFFQIEKTRKIPHSLGKGAFRVLTLGGSTTYGSKLDRDKTYPAVLEKLLQENNIGKTVQVLNAGVPWHTSMHSLLRYTGKFADWKPNVVIIMHAFNDIFQTSEGQLTNGKYRDDYGHYFGAIGQRVNPGDEMAKTIHHILTKNWLARTWYSDLHDATQTVPKQHVDLLRPLPAFRRNLEQLIIRSKQDGAKVILLTQPYLYKDDMPVDEKKILFYDYYYKDYAKVPTISEQMQAMNAFNAAICDIARKLQVTLIDVEKSLPKSVALMFDDVHYTEKGAHDVAQIIFDDMQ
jgi:lysophospholipase L1-like esterase